MHFTEAETGLLKTWVIKKLEDISDADADVLADYALALVSTEDTEAVARANCIENLKDFLPNNAEQFVDELFHAIATKSYDPNAPKPKPAPPVPQLPTGPKQDALGPMNESRKRSFQWDRDETLGGQSGQMQGGNRPIKQLRRGGRAGFERGGRQQQGPMPPFAPQQFSQQPHMQSGPLPPAGFPPLDVNDPAAMMALQQFMGAMAGFPNSGSPPNGLPFRPPGSAGRCRDYDMKGFCAAGASCPYDHDDARFVPYQNQEYDPSNATLDLGPRPNANFNTFNRRGRGGTRGRGRGTDNFRGGGKRSDFSMLGPNRDSTNTSIVVEQIPDEKLDERSVRDFFSNFGDIEEVTMHMDRKLAIVKYESKSSAKAAYDSPKVVFDNRFVKVYWYNSERFEQQHSGTPATRKPAVKTEDIEMQDDEEQIDHAELAKRQEEAQRKHDEARKQRAEAEKQKASLDEKLNAMEAERKKMAALLAKKAGKGASPATGSPIQNGEEESEQTKGLRVQLAKLEAEAKELGIDPDAPTNYDSFSSPPPYRGRGGYRGRGRGRGRGFYQPYRGGWGGGGAARGGAVMRLDNRPKTIAVTFANDNTYEANDEALRQFLLFNSMDTAAITQHPEKEDTALLTFNQRFEAENFLLAARNEIPHAGKVEAGWYSGTANGVKVENGTNGTNGVSGNGYGNGFADVKMVAESEAGDREMYDGGEREEQDLDRFA